MLHAFCFFLPNFVFYAVVRILNGMANSVDPEQTAPSILGLQFAYATLPETLVNKILGHLS